MQRVRDSTVANPPKICFYRFIFCKFHLYRIDGIFRGEKFCEFRILEKNIHRKQKIYMVHTLLLTDSQNFNPTKYTPLYGIFMQGFYFQKIIKACSRRQKFPAIMVYIIQHGSSKYKLHQTTHTCWLSSHSWTRSWITTPRGASNTSTRWLLLPAEYRRLTVYRRRQTERRSASPGLRNPGWKRKLDR